MAIEAELKSCCPDETITFMLMTGMHDQQIRKRCLRLGYNTTLPISTDVKEAAKIIRERRSNRGIEKIKEAVNRIKGDNYQKKRKFQEKKDIKVIIVTLRKIATNPSCAESARSHMAKDCYSKKHGNSASPKKGGGRGRGRSPSPGTGSSQRGRLKARREKSAMRQQEGDIEMEDVSTSKRYVDGKQTPLIKCTFMS